eukprot:SAG22_NODE_21107_length_260_cov_0.633540_1_plen_62_part_01
MMTICLERCEDAMLPKSVQITETTGKNTIQAYSGGSQLCYILECIAPNDGCWLVQKNMQDFH